MGVYPTVALRGLAFRGSYFNLYIILTSILTVEHAHLSHLSTHYSRSKESTASVASSTPRT